MLAYFIIPALLGAGYALDFLMDEVINDEKEDNEGIRVNGSDGQDLLAGTTGNDTLFGAGGSDGIVGSSGDDRIFLGDGDDISAPLTAFHDAGNDFIRGGAGNDLITDTQGYDTIYGDKDDDTIIAIDGFNTEGSVDADTPYAPDSIHGGYGEDILYGDAGDTLTGGHDVDEFVVAAPSQDDHAPAVITDFDAENETLSIVFLDEAPDDTTVIFHHDSQAGLVRALVEGEEVATLQGLNADSLQKINAYVGTLPQLMEATPS